MNPQRSVTHLASFAEGKTSNAHTIAVCDDGTVWALILSPLTKSEWVLIPSIPGTQTKEPA